MKRSLAWFLAVGFGFSWTLWGFMIASQRGWVSFSFPMSPWGSFGPLFGALAAVVMSGESLRPLFRSLVQWRARAPWYAFALLLSPLLYAMALAAYVFKNGWPPVNLSQWYLFFPILFLILFLGGPLGEEPGWRGFLLPLFQRKYSALTSAILVGVFWFAWHLPLFWLKGSAQEAMPVWAFGVFVMAQSVLFTWLYNGSGGSTFLALLYHTVNNTVSFCLPYAAPKLQETGFHEYVYLILIGVLAIGVVAITRGRLGAPVEPQSV